MGQVKPMRPVRQDVAGEAGAAGWGRNAAETSAIFLV